jgi:preprotein translocase subunit SecE
MERFTNYLRDVATELKHVSWPTQRQAMIYSALVIGISILAALMLGAFDFLFTSVLERITAI